MITRRIKTHWLKVGGAGLGAVAALVGAIAVVKPPPLTPVAVLKHSVDAMTPVPASAVTWVRMEHPPRGTVTAWAGLPLAAQRLPAGTVLTVADFTSATQAIGLKTGEVRYVVPITPTSAVVTLGARVDVWSVPTATGSSATVPQELAQGVRVIGLYTAQGQPVSNTATSGGLLSPNSGTPQTPALAALAVPGAALPVLMAANPDQTALLIADPTQTQFGLLGSPPAQGGTTHTTHSTPS
uniref:SAF domain-containing protein n=1 Tax=Sulfobacillus thermotolerans TaxID=338644 RepID=G5CJ68_9FIRM|nr:hypothetical protein [Sulfobacillus thermotolerans]AEP14345.1 hypothetical protein [Sulfobacillus thermotolerans]